MSDIPPIFASQKASDLMLEIKGLKEQLKQKNNELFIERLAIVHTLEQTAKYKFKAGPNCWSISYRHVANKQTCKMNTSSTALNSKLDNRTSKITFGCNLGKYFIKGGMCKFNIYKNTSNVLRIINEAFDYIYDFEEHQALIEQYIDDVNVPESLALAFLTFMAENNLTNEDIVRCYS